jgi:predicted outer membrane repeat protein
MFRALARLFGAREVLVKTHGSRSFRPGVEALEDRLTPATIPVTTFADIVDPGDGRLSLREAVTRANATAERDTVVLRAGVYRLGLAGAGEDGNASGDLDVTNPLTVVGRGASATAIDGGKRDRLFEILGTYNVRFSGMTLRNGGGSLDGGAVQAQSASLTLERCVVSGNFSSVGGGINAGSGDVTLVRCIVSGNIADGRGGGVRVTTGQLTLRDSVVQDNLAATEGGGIASAGGVTLIRSTVRGNSSFSRGGGISADTVTLTRSTVTGNSGRSAGGGIDARSVTLTRSVVSGNDSADGDGGGIQATTAVVTGSVIRGNSADGSGGGISAFNVTLADSTISGNRATLVGGGISANSATLTNSTVSGNSVQGDGGGIAAGRATLTNSTLSGNTAGGDGGGLHAAVAALTNCTVTLNRSLDEGGGVYHLGIVGVFSVKNTIIAQNRVLLTARGPDVFGAFASQGHNLIGNGAGGTGFGADGDQVGTADNPLDARLAPLAFNGGPTPTHALLPGSRAIDRGDNLAAPARDQRGALRPRDGDGNGRRVADIGAFER